MEVKREVEECFQIVEDIHLLTPNLKIEEDYRKKNTTTDCRTVRIIVQHLPLIKDPMTKLHLISTVLVWKVRQIGRCV